MKNKKIIAIVGLPGSGKTEVGKYFVELGCAPIRLGQLTLDEVRKRGLMPGEASERPIREVIRKKHGMGAYATLNFPKIDSLLKNDDVVVDGLYSWEEYVEFKNKYGKKLTVIAVYASPKIRHERLAKRKWDKKNDIKMVNRPYTEEQAKERDYAEISGLHTGGPIAMADFTIINEGSKTDLSKNLKRTGLLIDKNLKEK
ncbi:MAG: AAA family ATPase [bacterium]|nr:AAA family ATPase [bacterium]